MKHPCAELQYVEVIGGLLWHAGTLLSKLLGEQEFEKLPFTVRQQLLEGCGSVLGSISQAQQDSIITSLPVLSSSERNMSLAAKQTVWHRKQYRPRRLSPESTCSTIAASAG